MTNPPVLTIPDSNQPFRIDRRVQDCNWWSSTAKGV